MTLFIACLIIYQFDMNPWLYGVAAVLWAAHVAIFWLAQYRISEETAAAGREARNVGFDVREVGREVQHIAQIASNIDDRV